ncbi:tetraspanin-2A [Aethina tumida]|uniref:tetraspanin-2A n=1 Tax=Aethina tumida TaxID=116153 RepID=UPI00096B3DC8|nr:tetraspanin-2A [Aethina tumida]
MAGKGEGEGDGLGKLTARISVIKYVLVASNSLLWMLGLTIFALCLWMRVEDGIQEWLIKLDATNFYIGVYILIAVSIIIMLIAFFGCVVAVVDNNFFSLIYIGIQAIGFVLSLAGAAVLLDYSARNSRFQPIVRDSMLRLISNAHHEESRQTLSMIQENIACCGADGASDYVKWNQPLPSECRDTVTGNAFYHGCVDELTWFFEEKCAGIAGLAMAVCFFAVMNAVLTIVLMQALKKEEQEITHEANRNIK